MKRALSSGVCHLASFMGVLLLAIVATGCLNYPKEVKTNPAVKSQRAPDISYEERTEDHSSELFKEGREIFRYDTFGSEAFWGDQLRLHQAIAGEKLGGVGPGLTAKQ